MNSCLVIVEEMASANGVCARAVMEEMRARGIAVSCVTNRDPQGPKRYEKDGINYYTVRPRLVIGAMAKQEKGLRKSALYARLNRLMDRAALVRSIPTWPLISPLYARRLMKTAERACREQDCDTVIPIYNQIDTLIAAHRIKRKAPALRYIPYFLDSLSGGYGPRQFSPEWTVQRGLKWERKLLDNADLIVMMESSRAHHLKYSAGEPYYSRMRFLGLPLLRESQRMTPEPHEGTEILYVGTLPPAIRSPEYFLLVFEKWHDPSLRLTFVGTKDCDVLNAYAQRDRRVRVVGRVSHEEAEQYERRADVLLNLGNRNRNMVPCKIFEYMALGKPVLSVSPDGDEPGEQYLRRYSLSMILPESTSPAEAAASAATFVAKTKGKTVPPEQLREEFWLHTPRAFVDTVFGSGE